MSDFTKNPDFNPGGIPDKHDDRDYSWRELGASLPPFDWSRGYDVELELRQVLNKPSFDLPVKDQNGSFSCGGQAWATYASVLEAIATKTFEERSAKFIYSQTFVPGGGSMGRDNAKIFTKQGAAREAVLPSYENGIPPGEAFMERRQDITAPVQKDAQLARSLSYALVPANIDDVAQAIEHNHGAILLVLGENNGTWLSDNPKPPKATDQGIWVHWIYAGKVCMYNGKKAVVVLNSWGNDVGINGWQILTEDYFTSGAVIAVWTHVFNPNPPAPTFSYEFTEDIFFDQYGDEVRALQAALQVDGSFPSTVPITGYYGNVTRQAVLAFQTKYQVAPPAQLAILQGRKVGPATRAKLNQFFNL